VWQSLEEAGRRLATAGAGRSTAADTTRVTALLAQLATYERYWLYPGEGGLRRLQDLLVDGDTVRLVDEITNAVQLLTTYGDRAATFDPGRPPGDQELINKTSINTVQLIFTIGVTWSSVQYLLDALLRIAGELTTVHTDAGRVAQAVHRRRVDAITHDLPSLPDFSAFAPAFRGNPDSPAGDMRGAFYAGYEESDREYVDLPTARHQQAAGRTLVSTTFVVPYPPGFPVLVPGQVISHEILEFMDQLDVKEIHGYEPDLGFQVFTEAALTALDDRPGRRTA